MKNDHEPGVRQLSLAEIEALRQEMRESIEWAQIELARRRVRRYLSMTDSDERRSIP